MARAGQRSGQREARVAERLPDRVSVGVLASVFPVSLVDEVVEQAGAREVRYRSLPARLMVYYVIALALFSQQGYDEVMRLLTQGLSWLSGWSRAWEAPSVPAISKARARLGEAPLALLFSRVAGPVAAAGAAGTFWRGLRLVAVDGMVLDVAGTPQNAAFFGRPSGGEVAGPFPQARVVAVGECGTGALIGAALGPLSSGEQPLLREILPSLGAGMLLLADRNFPSRGLWREAAATGAQLLWRVSASFALPVTKVLADGTYLSVLRPARKKDGDPVTVRVIEYQVTGAAGEPTGEIFALITTLLDPGQAPAEELAALYPRRWESETIYASLKTHQRGPAVVLRSKTPQMARQEIWAMLCAYQGIRALMWQAAATAGCDPGGPGAASTSCGRRNTRPPDTAR
ncbi:MAG: IS4 family transposase [Streptosporangiaceae bacterium]